MTDATKRAPTVYIGNNTWQVEHLDAPDTTVVTTGPPIGHVMARINPYKQCGEDAEREIAALIAAAPELLEAVKAVADADWGAEYGPGAARALDIVRNAITKAKGNDNA